MNKLFKVRIGRKYFAKTREEIKEDMRGIYEKTHNGAITDSELEKLTDIVIFLIDDSAIMK